MKASRLSVRYAPPKRATAVIDARLGGGGIKREAAAARMIKATTTNRGLDIAGFSLSPGFSFLLLINQDSNTAAVNHKTRSRLLTPFRRLRNRPVERSSV